ncbi:MAG TPA: EFR1 family ferrodoxin [Ruminiclostridium sp.]|nr:EFR1 family ferrodoxin [Ruminiclostridium sp.]
MIVKTAAVLLFSPTGTTKKIMYEITEGMNIGKVNIINLTFPGIRNGNIPEISEDILLVGLPVYEERIPLISLPFLSGLRSSGKPIVLITVYGNIGDGIALNELKSLMENSGFIPVAAGSFIGEHSFSTVELPLAKGLPDKNELNKAQELGKMIAIKLQSIIELSQISLTIPQGKLPFITKILPKNSARMFTKTPSEDTRLCNHCGVCVKLCPVSAINQNTLVINESLCLRCFSCVKNCGKKARNISYKKKFLVTGMLAYKNRIKKEPKIYL